VLSLCSHVANAAFLSNVAHDSTRAWHALPAVDSIGSPETGWALVALHSHVSALPGGSMKTDVTFTPVWSWQSWDSRQPLETHVPSWPRCPSQTCHRISHSFVHTVPLSRRTGLAMGVSNENLEGKVTDDGFSFGSVLPLFASSSSLAPEAGTPSSPANSSDADGACVA